MSKLNNGEGPDSTSDSLKVQVLPDNGVLWNLDRIDQRKLPLNREYTCVCASPALQLAMRCLEVTHVHQPASHSAQSQLSFALWRNQDRQAGGLP